MLVVAAITALCYVGIHQSARFNAFVVAIKVTVILLFLGFGVWYVSGANWHPFIPPNTGEFGHFGWSGIVQGAGIIFFAYIGFDAVSTAAQEAKNPQRDMPIGITRQPCNLHGALRSRICGAHGDGARTPELDSPAPIAVALDRYPQLAWLAGFIKAGAIAGMTSVILVMMLGQPRIFYACPATGCFRRSSGRCTRNTALLTSAR